MLVISNFFWRWDCYRNPFCVYFLRSLTVFKKGLFGAAPEMGGSKMTSYLNWRRSKKYVNHVTHPLSFGDISIFSPEISNFCYIKKYRYRLHFNTWLLVLLTFFESLKDVLINMVAILMMLTKLATPGLLKIEVF